MGISIGSHIFLILLLCGSIGGDNFLGNSTSSHSEAGMAKRQKRFLVFEKGSSFTVSKEMLLTSAYKDTSSAIDIRLHVVTG